MHGQNLANTLHIIRTSIFSPQKMDIDNPLFLSMELRVCCTQKGEAFGGLFVTGRWVGRGQMQFQTALQLLWPSFGSLLSILFSLFN